MKKQTTQKEAQCPQCKEVAVFHKETDYETGTLEQYPYGRPVWQCGLCNHLVSRRIKIKQVEQQTNSLDYHFADKD